MSNMQASTPPLVGRDAELDRLERCLQDAIDGRPQVVLLSGEAGIGKTRLLQELQAIAKRCRVQVCPGRCSEDFSLPYQPFTDSLFPRLAETIPKAGGDADAETLRRFLRPSTDPAAGGDSAQHNKLRLFGAVARATLRLAQRAPLLLVVDDLHWADRASLDLLTQIVFGVADAAGPEPVSLMIAGAHRPVEPGHHVARAIARFQPESVCLPIELMGLAESDVESLLASLGDAHPSHRFVATITEATQGNPLFVQQAFYHLSEQSGLHGLSPEVVAKTGPLELQFPEQLVGAITARAQGLGADCRRVLVLGALFGDRFPLDGLCAAAGGNTAHVAALLDEAVRQRLILSEGQTFAFAHPLIRHVFSSEPSAHEKQRLHRSIATALEGLYAGALDAHLLEIAHHWISAGPDADLHKVVAYARRAGDQAFAVFASGEAAHSYEAALTAAESIADFPARERAELHYRAALAHYRDMNAGASIAHYGKAADAYGALGDVRGVSEALMGTARIRLRLAGTYGTLIDVEPLQDVVRILGDTQPALRGQIWATLSEAYWTARQPEHAEELARRAWEIGRTVHDDALCAQGSFALALAQIQSLKVREALDNCHASLELARRVDDPWLQSWPLQRISLALAWLGRVDDAEAAAEETRALTQKTLDWSEQSLALSALAYISAIRGDFDATEAYAHQAMLRVSRSGYPWGGLLFAPALAYTRCMRGAWQEASDAMDMLVEPGRIFEDPGAVLHVIAWVVHETLNAHAGLRPSAPQGLADSLLIATADGGSDIGLLPLTCVLVDIADCLDLPALAASPYATVAAAAGRGLVLASGWMSLLPRILGVAASLNRWWDKAEQHLDTAIEAATNARARPELARSYLDYARMLSARNGGGDRERAIELLGRAAPLLAELGMEPFLQRALQLAQALGTRLDVALPHPAYPDNLSVREVRILTLLARGRTDQVIARELLLKTATVADYVSGIFRKIGVDDRGAAAAYAVEKGLRVGSAPPGAESGLAGEGTPRPAYRPLPSTQPVAILFTDMEGSTALLQHVGDAKAQEILRTHNAIIRRCLKRYRGMEIKHTGDGIMASFPSATTAVACAVATQRAIAEHNSEHPHQPIRMRIGINAGEPIAEEGQLFGSAVNLAARLCDHSRPGQILVSDVVRQLLAGKGIDLVNQGQVTFKGFSSSVCVFEVPWRVAGAPAE